MKISGLIILTVIAVLSCEEQTYKSATSGIRNTKSYYPEVEFYVSKVSGEEEVSKFKAEWWVDGGEPFSNFGLLYEDRPTPPYINEYQVSVSYMRSSESTQEDVYFITVAVRDHGKFASEVIYRGIPIVVWSDEIASIGIRPQIAQTSEQAGGGDGEKPPN